MLYEIKKADIQNFKEYTIWEHATDGIWEVRPEDWHVGSDILVLVDEKRVMEFDYHGKHFCVFIPSNGIKYISKKEEFKDMGIQNVVYITFTDDEFVNVRIKEKYSSAEEKLNKIKEILAERTGITDSQEFGLTYAQAIDYLDQIEEVTK